MSKWTDGRTEYGSVTPEYEYEYAYAHSKQMKNKYQA